MPDWKEEDHPRGPDGRFGEGGLSTWAKSTAAKEAKPLGLRLEKDGGFSHRPGEESPTTGFMVSHPPEAGHGKVLEMRDFMDRDPPPTEAEVREHVEKAVEQWLEKELPFIRDKGDHYLGGWAEKGKDGETLAIHLDVSQRFTDKDKAIAAGRDRNQLAIFHLDTFTEIPTGGTGR